MFSGDVFLFLVLFVIKNTVLLTIPHNLLCFKVVFDKLYLRWTEGPLSKTNIFKVSP